MSACLAHKASGFAVFFFFFFLEPTSLIAPVESMFQSKLPVDQSMTVVVLA